jgi:hypothetical protein
VRCVKDTNYALQCADLRKLHGRQHRINCNNLPALNETNQTVPALVLLFQQNPVWQNCQCNLDEYQVTMSSFLNGKLSISPLAYKKRQWLFFFSILSADCERLAEVKLSLPGCNGAWLSANLHFRCNALTLTQLKMHFYIDPELRIAKKGKFSPFQTFW